MCGVKRGFGMSFTPHGKLTRHIRATKHQRQARASTGNLRGIGRGKRALTGQRHRARAAPSPAPGRRNGGLRCVCARDCRAAVRILLRTCVRVCACLSRAHPSPPWGPPLHTAHLSYIKMYWAFWKLFTYRVQKKRKYVSAQYRKAAEDPWAVCRHVADGGEAGVGGRARRGDHKTRAARGPDRQDATLPGPSAVLPRLGLYRARS